MSVIGLISQGDSADKEPPTACGPFYQWYHLGQVVYAVVQFKMCVPTQDMNFNKKEILVSF